MGDDSAAFDAAGLGESSDVDGPSSPRVIDILRNHTRGFLRAYPRTIPLVRKVLEQIHLCRTPALLYRRYQCSQCAHETYVYNSCGQRHCPQCSGARRAKWLDQRANLILPGIDYFQVVFTIPDRLSRLVLGNRRLLYSTLFKSAWAALAAELKQQQIEPAALLVLHTWNQDLQHHPHVHALVPGGGPSLNGDNDRCWVTARDKTRPWRQEASLVDVVTLGRRFRDTYVRRLGWLVRHDRLKLKKEWEQLKDPRILKEWLKSLRDSDWNVFIQGPPHGESDPKSVLKYLTRYLSGGPISDARIVSEVDGQVEFQARVNQKSGAAGRKKTCGEKTGGKKNRKQRQRAASDVGTRRVWLSGVEFVRRWSLHILPKWLSRSRFCGGYHGKKRTRYMQDCIRLLKTEGKLQVDPTGLLTNEGTDEKLPAESWRTPQCPRCEAEMVCIENHRRPSWRRIFASPQVTSIRGSP